MEVIIQSGNVEFLKDSIQYVKTYLVKCYTESSVNIV